MGISVTQLLIILAIVVVLFGTKRIRSLGGDLGGAIRSFRSAMKESESEAQDKESLLDDKDESPAPHSTISEKDNVKR